MPKLYDITPPVSPALGVWPGDTPLSREVLCDLKLGSNITLSTLRATVHLGAHADGPNHYGRDGRSIDEQSLDYYLGPCQVIRTRVARGTRVGIADIKSPIVAPRVLLATATFPDPNHWNNDFAAIEPSVVDHLHAQGVRLVGIDTPSVDLIDSKNLAAHARFFANDMAILEGITLQGVPEGVYELIALPLKLVGFDASPVRAILRAI